MQKNKSGNGMVVFKQNIASYKIVNFEIKYDFECSVLH